MSVIRSFNAVLKSSAGGITLKVLSLFSKFLFLLLIVPQLAIGVFTSYLFDLTVAAIVSKVVSFGAADRIPLLSSSYNSRSRYQLLILSLLMLCISIVSFLVESRIMVGVLICLVLVGTSFVSGLLRVRSPFLYELIMNFPALLLFIASLSVQLFRENLIATYTICVAVTGFMATLFAYIKFSFDEKKQGLATLGAELLSLSSLKFSFSAISQMLLLRSPVLVSEWLKKSSDTIAISVSLGEIVYQLLVVISNRTYSDYLAKKQMVSVSIIALIYVFSWLAMLAFPFYLVSGLNLAFLSEVDTWFVQCFVLYAIHIVLWVNTRNALWFFGRHQLVFLIELCLVSLVYFCSLVAFDYYLIISSVIILFVCFLTGNMNRGDYLN